ncbi:MAG: DUF2125 domain-containing protein, partial [Pseudomonadota bacterium]
MSKTTYIVGGVIAVAVIWTGGWFAGKSFIVEPEADKAVEQLRSGDLFFSYDAREVGGFPLAYDVAYTGVSVSNGQGWRWEAPSMTVGSGVTDGGALIVEPSEESRLTVETAALSGDAEAADIVFDIASDALRIALASDGSFDLSAIAISANQTKGDSLVRGGLFEVDDLTASGAASPEGALTAFDLTTPMIRAAYRISEDGVQELHSDQTYTDFSVSYATDTPFAGDFEAFLAQAVESGRLELTIGASGTTGTSGMTGGPSAPPMDFAAKSGAMEGVFSIIDGRIRYAVKADAADMTMAFGEPSPFPGGDVKLGDIVFDMAAPMRKADGPQPYVLTMNLAGKGRRLAEGHGHVRRVR